MAGDEIIFNFKKTFIKKVFRFLPANNSNIDKYLKTFLNKADDAYIKAFQYKVLGEFSNYATPSVYSSVQQKIIYRNNRIWGADDFRKRNWSVITKTEDEIVVRKELTFKSIKFGHTLVPMGDELIEYWSVIKEGKSFKIKEIQSNA